MLQANIVISSCCSGLKKQNYSNNGRKTCSETYENSSDDHTCGLKTVIETFYRTIAKGTTGTKASNIGIARENEKKEGSKWWKMKGNTKEILLGMKENRNGGPWFQPSSFVVLSSTSLSLPKWVWSLLAVGFLLLSSFAFFIWPGCGFPGYKEENSQTKLRKIKQSFQRLHLSPSFFIFLVYWLCSLIHLLRG